MTTTPSRPPDPEPGVGGETRADVFDGVGNGLGTAPDEAQPVIVAAARKSTIERMEVEGSRVLGRLSYAARVAPLRVTLRVVCSVNCRICRSSSMYSTG